MKRSALLLALATSLAACDSVGPTDPDALIGTWEMTRLAQDLRVTSRTDQTLPDLTAAPQGAVAVSGIDTPDLTFLGYVYDNATAGEQELQLFSENPARSVDGVLTELYMWRYSEAGDVQLNPVGNGGGALFARLPEGDPIFTRDGTTITVPRVDLDAGDQAVSVGGSLTFPTITLAAGTETTVSRGRGGDIDEDPRDDGIQITFRFDEDGAFEAVSREGNRAETTSGTWTSETDGVVEIAVREDDVTTFTTLTFEVVDGTLRMETSDFEAENITCDRPCLESFESILLAESGSFSAVDLITRFEFEETDASAAAATTETQSRPGPPSRWPIPVVRPL